MLQEASWMIPLGLFVGTFGTLIGAGGGFVLMPVLMIIYPHDDPLVWTAISLAVVFCNAASGSVAYARMKRIDYGLGAIFAAATLPGAVLGAITVRYVPGRIFHVVMGLLLVAVSAFLIRRPVAGGLAEQEEEAVRRFMETGHRPYSFRRSVVIGIPLGLGVGYLSSILGIGGGIIHVPAMIHLLGFPVHMATATSHFVLAIMALAGSLVHLVDGSLRVGAWRVLWLSIGVVVGAQIGAALSRRLHGVWIVRALAIALGLLGLRILFWG